MILPSQVRRPALAMLLILVASALAGVGAGEHNEYSACLVQAERTPMRAFEHALAWRDDNGGFPARHCAAVALVSLGQYGDAAARLEKLAEDMQVAGGEAVAEILGQAGNAWLLGGFANRAETVLNAALRLDPENPDLLIDRAQAHAATGRYAQAAQDLDRALAADSQRADALIFRASARRRLGQIELAAGDLARALSLEPDNPEALLERGLLAMRRGAAAAARRDLLRVRMLVPGSAAADAAGANLERLDFKQE